MIISGLLMQWSVQSAMVQTLVFTAEFLYCFVSHMTMQSAMVQTLVFTVEFLHCFVSHMTLCSCPVINTQFQAAIISSLQGASGYFLVRQFRLKVKNSTEMVLRNIRRNFGGAIADEEKLDAHMRQT